MVILGLDVRHLCQLIHKSSSPASAEIISLNRRRGRSSIRIGLWSGLDSKPNARPSNETIGEPDIPGMTLSAGSTDNQAFPLCTEHSNHSPSSEKRRALQLCSRAGASVIKSGCLLPRSLLYELASSGSAWSSGMPSTAMSAIGSANRHSAHTVGSAPSGPNSAWDVLSA